MLGATYVTMIISISIDILHFNSKGPLLDANEDLYWLLGWLPT